MNLEKLLSFEDGRIAFFETLTKHPENWQQNPTPLSIVHKMVDKTSLDDKKILVLFNIEFLQALVEERKIDPKNIYYIADNELEYLGAIKIFKVQSYKLNDFSVPALKKLVIGIDMKFDLVFSNPPYTDYVDLKILNETISLFKEFIAVHPSAFILKDGGDNTTINKFNNLLYKKTKSIEFIDPYITFNGVLNPTPCVITHYDNSYDGDIKVSYNLDKFFNIDDTNYIANNFNTISIYGSKYESTVLPFKRTIEKYCKDNGSLLTIKQNKISLDDTKCYCQLPQIIGQVNRTKNFKGFYEHTFFTLMPLSEDTDIVFEDGEPKKSKKNNFVFDTYEELQNFKNYLKTDFVRFCLSFKKFSKNLQSDSFELIPLVDFKQKWNDEILYAHFNVSDNLASLIQEFLPDCYGIRK